jgi:O-antigen ligase
MRAAPRQAVVTSALVCLVFAICFLGTFTNAFGANAVLSPCASTCTAVSPGSDEKPLRGGTALTGREFLWKASWEAIKKRPVTGYGPGNNVPAIDPYLSGVGLQLKGLTSHSTWFRTAVEMGVPGLLLLIAVLVVAGWVFVRGPRSEIPDVPDPTRAVLAASVIAMIPVMTFESVYLGGVTFTSLYLAVAIGLTLPAVRLSALTRRTLPA